MDYSLLTEQQLQKRYYSLSLKLRDVLDSENNLENIRQICLAHHLNDDKKIMIVRQLITLILLGFVSADDFSREISENIPLNRQHSGDIAAEIDRKIFSPIKADLEKVYSPVLEGETEIASPLARNDEIEIGERELEEGEKPIFIEIRKPEAPIRIIEADERGENEIASALPRNDVIEADRRGKEIQESVMGEAEPMIIHEETEFKPLSESKKPLKSLSGLFGFLNNKSEKIKEPAPIKAEVSGIEDIQLPKEKPTKIKVVNYTEVPDLIEADKRGDEIASPSARNDEIEEKIKEVKPPKVESETPEIAAPEMEIQSEKELETKVSKFESLAGKLFGFLKKKEKKEKIISIEPFMVAESEVPIKIAEDTRNEEIKKEPIAEPPIIELPSEEQLITDDKPLKKIFFGKLFRFLKKKKETADIQIIEKAPLLKEEIFSVPRVERLESEIIPEFKLEIITPEIEKDEIASVLPRNDDKEKPEQKPKKKFFRNLINSSKSLFIKEEKEIHYKEEIKDVLPQKEIKSENEKVEEIK